MTRQLFRLNAAFMMLDGITGRMDTEDITDKLIEIGYIANSPDDYRDYQVVQARDTLRQYRRSKAKAGDVQGQLVNLTETLEDGSKHSYWKKCRELTPSEAVKHIRYWDTKIGEAQEHRDQFHAFYLEKHGDLYQRLLGFGPDDVT